MYNNKSILNRHKENPILTPEDFPGAAAVRNCGQTVFGEKTLLLLTVDHLSGEYQGVRGKTSHVAVSEDGIHFDINPEPFLYGSDTRITRIEDSYYIAYPAKSDWGTFAMLGKTDDFKHLEEIETISLPDNRLPCLFPEKINGKYYRVDRPYRVLPDNMHNYGNLWISSSPDLVHWGYHRPLMKAGNGTGWGGCKIGPTPPLRTDSGWLMLTHGVTQSCSGHRYQIGAVLMDLNDPVKLVGYTKSPVLFPSEPYELCGRVPNIVFPCGAIADYENDQIRVYYGAADTCIGLATGYLSELIGACINKS